jgi:hypothetical protein
MNITWILFETLLYFIHNFLWAFTKLQTATIHFVTSVCLPIRPPVSMCLSILMQLLDFHPKDFHELMYLIIFLKSVDRIQVSLKSDKNKSTLHEIPMYGTFMIISCLILLRVRNVSDKNRRENQNTFMSNKFFWKIVQFMR